MSQDADADYDAELAPEGDRATVAVENVGGIDECEVTFSPGVTILTGRNATNRTSLLSAIAGALGGDAATLKSDADEGSVTLTVGDETYTRQYERRGPSVATSGDPYSDDGDVVDLFVSLLGDNPARRAVERGDDLRDVIMRPVDTEQIRREIRNLEGERDRVESQIAEVERDRDRLPALEERRTNLEDDLAAVKDDLADVRERVENYDADEREAEQAEELVDELEGLRQDLRRTEEKIDRQEAELQRLESEREEVQAELDDLEVPEDELDDLEAELDRLRQQKRSLDGTVADLGRIVEFNDELVSGEAADLPGVEAGDGVAAELDPMSQTVECWTCGSTVERADIAERLDSLREQVAEKRAERDEVVARIDELTERRRELESVASSQSELRRRLDDIEREIEHRERNRDEFEADAEDVRDEIAEVEARVEETEDLRDSDLVDAYRRLSELEYERGKLEQELDDVEAELDDLEDAADRLDDLRERREEIGAELSELRSRIDDLERAAVEQFNHHMEEVLDVLGYGNIARVWIERKAEGGRGGQSRFDLHVVREGEGGAVYEDSVDNLSESEREVIGLVVALAGYLVHDVYETVPMMLLDSLEAIDADRIAALVDYFREYAPYLVVALLPGDEQALSPRYERVTADALSPA